MEAKSNVVHLNAKQAQGWPGGVGGVGGAEGGGMISEVIKEKIKDLPLLLDAKDLEKIIPVNRTAIYELFKREGFPKFRLGRRLMVPTHLFFKFLEDEARKLG